MANEVKLFIRVDDQGTVKVKQFGDTTKATLDGIEKKGQNTFSIFGSGAKTLGVALAAAFSTDKLLEATRAMVQAGSTLEETNNKYRVVFREQMGLTDEWAKVLEENYLMSERAAKQYLAAMQDLLVPMGMNKDAAAKLSFEIVKLAADLGSFNNQTTEKVMEDIQSALVGNYETMKKYGVVLNETTVATKALEMGLASKKTQLTANMKAMAAYELIVKSSTAAIGDTARSADSYVSASKKLSAETENFNAAIGTKLLPTLAKLKIALAESLGDIASKLGNTTQDRIRVLQSEIEAAERGLAAAREHKSFFGEILGGSQINTTEQMIKWMKSEVEALQIESTLNKYAASLSAARNSPKPTDTDLTPVDEESLKKAESDYRSLITSITTMDQAGYNAKLALINKEYSDRAELYKGITSKNAEYQNALVFLERERLEKIKQLNEQFAAAKGPSYTSFAAGQRWDVQGLKSGEAESDTDRWDTIFEQAQDHKRREIELEQATADEIIAINERKWAALGTMTMSAGYSLMALGQESSRALFNAGKVAAIAGATLKARQSITDAYQWGMELGGPPLATTFSVLAKVATAAQLASLAKVQYQARALGGSVTAGDTYLVGERGPELFTARKSGTIVSNETLTRSASFSFSFDFRNARIMDESALMQRVKETCVEAYNEHIAEGGTMRKSAWA